MRTLLLLLLAMPSPSAVNTEEPRFKATVRLPSEKLVVGGTYALRVEVETRGEINKAFPWQEADGSSRRPLLFVDPPACIRLVGKPPSKLESPGDFQTAYLEYPYGRRILEKEVEIAFELVSKPRSKDRIGVIVVAYPGEVGVDSEEDSDFVRLRADLRVKRGAKATAKPSRDSSWKSKGGLHVGDEAPDFTVEGRGGEFSLGDYRGKSNVLLVFYRRET